MIRLNFLVVSLFISINSLAQINHYMDLTAKGYAMHAEYEYKKNNYWEAIEYLNMAVNKDSSYGYAYFLRGSTLKKVGEYSKAHDDLTKAIQYLRDSSTIEFFAYIVRGEVNWVLNEKKKACADWRIAAEINEPYKVEYCLSCGNIINSDYCD